MFRKSHAGAKNGFFLGQPIGTHEVAIGNSTSSAYMDSTQSENARENGDWLRAESASKSRRTATHGACPLSRGPSSTRLARRKNGTGTKAANAMFLSGKLLALLWSQSHFFDSFFTLWNDGCDQNWMFAGFTSAIKIPYDSNSASIV
jgi:hypothetical protein